jgi:hypothetical protein
VISGLLPGEESGSKYTRASCEAAVAQPCMCGAETYRSSCVLPQESSTTCGLLCRLMKWSLRVPSMWRLYHTRLQV